MTMVIMIMTKMIKNNNDDGDYNDLDEKEEVCTVIVEANVLRNK